MACATFYYSIDGASESERLSADALPELLAAGTIQPTTLIFSEEDGFTHDGWTAWSVCCAAFGFPAPPSAPGGSFLPCASLVYSTDGATQSPVVSAAEARALAGAGTIVGATLIFSEQPGFPFESWTPWADCHHCFAPAPPSGGALGEAPLGAAGAAIAAPAAAACSSLFYAGDPERLLSVPEALALVDAGTIGPTTLIFSEQPAFEFDDWTPWAACSFCFGAGERESSLSSAAQQQQQQQAAVRSCSSLFYSSDGASASEAIDAATAHELAKVGCLPPSALPPSPCLALSLSLSLALSLPLSLSLSLSAVCARARACV